MKIFTIIKENSERVPGKNFRNLGDKPLWKYALEKFSQYEIFVNTDSDLILSEIEDMRGELKITGIRRAPKHISWEEQSKDLGSPVVDMFIDFAKYFCVDEDIITLTHVTTPFLTPETLADAASYLDDGYATVHSVTMKRDVCWQKKGDKNISLNHQEKKVARTQDLQPFYFSNGAFFIIRKSTLLKYEDRIVEPCYLYPLSDFEGIEIDTEFDWKVAKSFYGD